MTVGHGDLTGSERSHISVSYHDAPFDASESMYFHERFQTMALGKWPLYYYCCLDVRLRKFWYSFNNHVYNPLLLLCAQKFLIDSQNA